MNKIILSLWISIICLTAYELFQIKYKVQYLERDLFEANRQLSEEKKTISLLNAEWAYLNNPGRIKKLANKHLHLNPIKTNQILTEALEVAWINENDSKYDNLISQMFIEKH